MDTFARDGLHGEAFSAMAYLEKCFLRWHIWRSVFCDGISGEAFSATACMGGAFVRECGDMVLDSLSNASFYDAIGPGFAAAFAWLRRHGATAAGAPVAVDGDRVVARPGAYETHPRDPAATRGERALDRRSEQPAQEPDAKQPGHEKRRGVPEDRERRRRHREISVGLPGVRDIREPLD